MTFVDHLKGVKTAQLFREVAFGLHVIEGDLAKSIVTGSSSLAARIALSSCSKSSPKANAA